MKAITLCIWFWILPGVLGADAARRLFDDLLTHYNRLVRPVRNHSETLQVRLNLKLSQLLDVHEKDQIMTTNVWLHQEWFDRKMKWNPDEYDGIENIYVPADLLWRPDLVLYNTADGNYDVKIMTKAMVRYTGLVIWEPPAVFRSVCEMDVAWFPLDEQRCKMKIGSWTYDGFMVDLIHYHDISEVKELVNRQNQRVWLVENAIDLSSYYPSVEWDIMAVPGERHFLFYPCCEAPFVDVTYYIHLRRKTLFYTVNLIIPCVGISFLTMFVFYLPANSGEKIVMCISILISLNVFLLLLIELIPSTSLAMPLIARYLLFTMILVALSVSITVFTLSIHYRAPNTHAMPAWVRRWFLRRIPVLLGMKPVKSSFLIGDNDEEDQAKQRKSTKWTGKSASSEALMETRYGTTTLVSNHQETSGSGKDQLPTIVVNETIDMEEREPILPVDRRGVSISDHTAEDGTEISESKSNELLEARLVHEVWERRQSLFPLLEMRERNRPGVEAGDAGSALRYAASCVALIAHKICRDAQEKVIQQEWSYVGSVIDRFFLYLFSTACLIGTCFIILQAPSLYDTRTPLP